MNVPRKVVFLRIGNPATYVDLSDYDRVIAFVEDGPGGVMSVVFFSKKGEMVRHIWGMPVDVIFEETRKEDNDK